MARSPRDGGVPKRTIAKLRDARRSPRDGGVPFTSNGIGLEIIRSPRDGVFPHSRYLALDPLDRSPA